MPVAASDTNVFVDFVVAADGADWLSPYTAAQLEALNGEIPWRLHRWDAWDSDEPAMTSYGSRQVPADVPRAGPAGFVARAESGLIDRASR